MRDDKIIEDHLEKESQLCDNDTSNKHKGLVGIYINNSLIIFFDGIAGWVGHINEPLSDNKLNRPRLSHLGKMNIPFVSMSER